MELSRFGLFAMYAFMRRVLESIQAKRDKFKMDDILSIFIYLINLLNEKYLNNCQYNVSKKKQIQKFISNNTLKI